MICFSNETTLCFQKCTGQKMKFFSYLKLGEAVIKTGVSPGCDMVHVLLGRTGSQISITRTGVHKLFSLTSTNPSDYWEKFSELRLYSKDAHTVYTNTRSCPPASQNVYFRVPLPAKFRDCKLKMRKMAKNAKWHIECPQRTLVEHHLRGVIIGQIRVPLILDYGRPWYSVIFLHWESVGGKWIEFYCSTNLKRMTEIIFTAKSVKLFSKPAATNLTV